MMLQRNAVVGISNPDFYAKQYLPTAVCTENLSVLIRGGNHLTSAHNDRAAMFFPDRLGLAISSRRAGLFFIQLLRLTDRQPGSGN